MGAVFQYRDVVSQIALEAVYKGRDGIYLHSPSSGEGQTNGAFRSGEAPLFTLSPSP